MNEDTSGSCVGILNCYLKKLLKLQLYRGITLSTSQHRLYNWYSLTYRKEIVPNQQVKHQFRFMCLRQVRGTH